MAQLEYDEPSEPVSDEVTIRPGLTEKQLHLILYAERNGYWEQPREIIQAEIAEHFGLTQPTITKQISWSLKKILGAYADEFDDAEIETWPSLGEHPDDDLAELGAVVGEIEEPGGDPRGDQR